MRPTVAIDRRNTARRHGIVYWIGIAASLLLATASYLALAASFAGTFSGTFSGDDSGNWSITVASNGAITGSGNSSSAGQSFSITGTVTTAGALSMGNASIGATFSGTISSTGAVSGNWSNPNFGESGKFSGSGKLTDVTTTTPPISVISNERVFKFAEANYPSLFNGVSTSGTFQNYTYRQYPATGHYLALDPSNVIYLLGPSTGNAIKPLGAASNFASQITQWEASQAASNGSNGNTSTSAGVSLTGNKHEYLKSRGRTQALQGRINVYKHNADGTRGSFYSSTAESCSILIDQDGHMTWGDSITYSYEKLDGIDAYAAGRARLYAFSYITHQPIEDSFLEYIDASQIVRRVSGAILEDECVPAATYDLAIAQRFPNVDGRLSTNVGTYKGEVILVTSALSPKTVRPAALVMGAACTADINPLGQVQVSIAGVKLPQFYTTDLNNTHPVGDAVMFSGNALINPQATYALEYFKPSYAELARAMSFGFTVHLAPLTYLNWADPQVDGDWSAMCLTYQRP